MLRQCLCSRTHKLKMIVRFSLDVSEFTTSNENHKIILSLCLLENRHWHNIYGYFCEIFGLYSQNFFRNLCIVPISQCVCSKLLKQAPEMWALKVARVKVYPRQTWNLRPHAVPVTSWANACSTCMHRPVVHASACDVTSQFHSCCMHLLHGI